MSDKFDTHKWFKNQYLNENSEVEDYETLYDVIAKKIGYTDSKQMFMNEDEISNQTKILANWICELKNKSIIFHDIL